MGGGSGGNGVHGVFCTYGRNRADIVQYPQRLCGDMRHKLRGALRSGQKSAVLLGLCKYCGICCGIVDKQILRRGDAQRTVLPPQPVCGHIYVEEEHGKGQWRYSKGQANEATSRSASADRNGCGYRSLQAAFVGSGRKLRMARQRKHGDIHYRKAAYDNALP